MKRWGEHRGIQSFLYSCQAMNNDRICAIAIQHPGVQHHFHIRLYESKNNLITCAKLMQSDVRGLCALEQIYWSGTVPYTMPSNGVAAIIRYHYFTKESSIFIR